MTRKEHIKKRLEILKSVNIGDYIIRAREALECGDIDTAAASVSGLIYIEQPVYSHYRRGAFKGAKQLFKWNYGLGWTIRRLADQEIWEYLKEYLIVSGDYEDPRY